MPRRKLPDEVKAQRGTLKPSTATGPTVQGRGELGEPPAELDERERAAWADIVVKAPRGVITDNDYLSVEHAARLLAAIRRGDDRPSILRLWHDTLHRFGMTPASRLTLPAADTPAEPDADLRAIEKLMDNPRR